MSKNATKNFKGLGVAYQGVATLIQSKQKFKKPERIEYGNDSRSCDLE